MASNDDTPTQADESVTASAPVDAASPETDGAPARKAARTPAKKTARKRAPRKSAAASESTDNAGTAADAAAADTAAAATAAAPAAADFTDAAPGASTDEGARTPAKKAARKRVSRKASAPVAAPEPVEPLSAPDDIPAADAVGEADSSPTPAALETESTPAQAPARKTARRSRRASAPQGASDAEAVPAASSTETPSVDDATDAPTDTSADTSTEAPTGAQAPSSPRRRRGRSSAAAQAVTADATDEEEADDDATSDAGSAPSFGVLFQAPAPTRSRRASAPAAAPTVAAPVDDESDQDDTRHRDVSGDAEESDDTGDSEGPSDGPRRRRRRGGKGRRGRANDTDTTDEEPTDSDAKAGVKGGRAGGRSRSKAVATATEVDADQQVSDTDQQVSDTDSDTSDEGEGEGGTRRRTRRRRRSGSSGDGDDAPGVTTRVREPRRERDRDEVTGLKGSTRLEAKKQRRREGREAGRRRTIITEAEFLARRESVERVMVVRTKGDRTQIGVLEDDVLVEHYISQETNVSMAGNIYLGRVQNVLPSMEAAFIDIGKGRNAVLYAGEVNWDAAGLESNQPKRIEHALSSGEPVLVQVTKDPIGHKGARLTSQISLPGRYLVYVPDSSMTGISRKLPDTERARLKKILKDVVPESAGVIVRTAAEGASEEELRADVERLTRTWEDIKAKAESAGGGSGKGKGKKSGGNAPVLLHGEPDLTVRVIRDVFNEDFTSLVVAGQQPWDEVSDYVSSVAPDLAERITRWTSEEDLFTHYRVDEQIAKAMDRKVWLPSGGSLVIDRTEAMTVVDVNTGKFIGSGGNLEETVTKNNIEAAEEIVRQLRLRDIGGIIVIDFIDMVLEANRELVVRRLLECLGRDRTKHQVAEVTSLGLVQMTRKRVGSGLIEVFGENCEQCNGRGIIVHADPVDKPNGNGGGSSDQGSNQRGQGGSAQGGQDASTGRGGTRGRRGRATEPAAAPPAPVKVPTGPTAAQIAAAAHAAALKTAEAGGPVPHDDDAILVGDVPSADAQRDLDLVNEIIAAEDGGRQDAATAEVDAATAEVNDGEVTEPEPTRSDEAAEQSRVSATEARLEHVGEPVLGLVPEPLDDRYAEPEPAPAPRARRRRGRVVAPAGPPRGAGHDPAMHQGSEQPGE